MVDDIYIYIYIYIYIFTRSLYIKYYILNTYYNIIYYILNTYYKINFRMRGIRERNCGHDLNNIFDRLIVGRARSD